MQSLVNDVIIEILRLLDLKSLIKFSMTDNHNMNFVKQFIVSINYNKKIKMNNRTKVTDNILQYLKGADDIDLTGCKNITNNGLKYLLYARTVDIVDCDYQKITDDGLFKLEKCRMLRLSSLDAKDKLTDNFFKPYWQSGGDTRFYLGFDLFG